MNATDTAKVAALESAIDFIAKRSGSFAQFVMDKTDDEVLDIFRERTQSLGLSDELILRAFRTWREKFQRRLTDAGEVAGGGELLGEIMNHDVLDSYAPRGGPHSIRDVTDGARVMMHVSREDNDPHMIVFMRHPSISMRWKIWVLCSRAGTVVTEVTVAGDEGRAMHRALMLADIGDGLLKPEELYSMVHARKGGPT